MPCQRSDHSKCVTEALQKIEHYCLQNDLRLTEMRREVFKVIWQSHKAITAAQVMEKLGNNQPPITYRALSFLVDHGFVHKVALLNAYVGCLHPLDEEHFGQLLICRECNDVTEVNLPHLREEMRSETNKEGFKIQQMNMEVLGKCRKCDQMRQAN